MQKEMILGLARHVLTWGGGVLVAKGLADATMVAEGVGALLTIAGIAWSAADKRRRRA